MKMNSLSISILAQTLILSCLLTACGKNPTQSPEPISKPNPPTRVFAYAAGSGVNILWDTVGEYGPTTYTVLAVEDTTKRCTGTWSKTECLIPDLEIGTPYSFVVRASNAAGTSEPSKPSPYVIPYDSSHVWVEQVSNPTYDPLLAVAWGSERLVAVGLTGTIVTSENGIQWTKRVSGTTSRLSDLAWNGQIYVAAGTQGTILSSANGIDWNEVESNTASEIYKLIWADSQFVGVAGKGDSIITSSNGTAWTLTKSEVSLSSLKSYAWGKNQLVAVGDSGKILTSPNGTTWTTQSSGTNNSLSSVCWTGSQFVAVGEYATVLTSINGSTWVDRSIPARGNRGFSFVLCANNRLTAVGSTDLIASSPDGITWTMQNFEKRPTLFSAAWTGSKYVAVGFEILTSP